MNGTVTRKFSQKFSTEDSGNFRFSKQVFYRKQSLDAPMFHNRSHVLYGERNRRELI